MEHVNKIRFDPNLETIWTFSDHNQRRIKKESPQHKNEKKKPFSNTKDTPKKGQKKLKTERERSTEQTTKKTRTIGHQRR